ncbi:MAG: phenylalanine--tRNA ligase subunit beta, partial [bacterium]|nr:phenylalanine--tRNA ligase subunit beta [bacterium]
ATYTREGDGKGGLFELKRLAECLLPGAGVAPAEARTFEHPARAYTVHWRGQTTGRLFELHPKMGEGRAAVLDVNLDIVHELGPLPKRYRPLRRYPTSAFDLSVLAGERELSGDIQRRLSELAEDSLESIVFVRQYSGAPLPDGKQSLSYRLTVFARDHTLTTDEVNAVRQRIIDGMQDAGYELRV